MAQDRMSVSIITPTYNERRNIPILAQEVFAAVRDYPEIDLELIVVDDNSPDGTGAVAESLRERYPIRVLHRAGKQGLGSAVMEGFRLSDRPYLGVIDADLSHDPSLIPQLTLGLREYDVTIGCRYDPKSSVEKWRWYRRLISNAGVFLARQLTGVLDPLSGYFFLHRRVIDGLALTSPGYKILLEILVKGNYAGTLELPFIFRHRKFSSSKLNLKEYYFFLKQILIFSLQKPRRETRDGT